MERSEGMMAVVRGLPDSGLAVTLVDGNTQFTLMPNAATTRPSPSGSPRHNTTTNHKCDSSSQAIDGRYTSMYKVSHCNAVPTSPNYELSEFPPQRAEPCHGHGNFVIGGMGSGVSSYSRAKQSDSFRGGLSWPDRGSVCSPRPSTIADPFSSSLRKYPSLSPERSAEIVQRLINYTQAKSLSKTQRSHSPPTRAYADTASDHSRSSKRTYCKTPEQRINNIEPHSVYRQDKYKNSEHRNCRGDDGSYHRFKFTNDYDVRYLREFTRQAMENGGRLSNSKQNNAVNAEVQAATVMASKEVATDPVPKPLRRNIATLFQCPHETIESKTTPLSTKKVTACTKNSDTFKCLEIARSDSTLRCHPRKRSVRKTQSQEILNYGKEENEIYEWLESISVCPNRDPHTCHLREKVLRNISKRLVKLGKNLDKIGVDNVKRKVENCLRLVPLCFSDNEVESQRLRQNLCDQLVRKLLNVRSKLHNDFHINIYRAEVILDKRTNNLYKIRMIVNKWLNKLPVKSIDFLGRPIKKELISKVLVDKICALMIRNTIKDIVQFKSEMIDFLEEIPMQNSKINKQIFLERLTNMLTNNFRSKQLENIREESKYNMNNEKTRIEISKPQTNIENKTKPVQPIENEMMNLVQKEINLFLNIHHKDINTNTLNQIEIDIVYILEDFLEPIKKGDVNLLKSELVTYLQYVNIFNEQQIYRFIDNLLFKLKTHFHREIVSIPNLYHSQLENYVVLQSLQQNCCNNENISDFTIEGITEEDIRNYVDKYTKQISQQIDEWLTGLTVQLQPKTNHGFQDLVVNDLAEDIVDRHKYLELNPSSRVSEEDELEQLKYQIFKWVNKLVGEDNTETIQHAPDLMRRIQNIPVPMLTKIPNNQTLQQTNDKWMTLELTRPDQQKNISNGKTHEKTGTKFDTNREPTTTRRHNSLSENIVNDSNRYRTKETHNISAAPADLYPSRNVSDNISDATITPTNRISLDSRKAIVTSDVNSTSFSESNQLSTVQQINNDFDAFLKKWIQEIPISANNPKEVEFAEKARLGIYNGIWKAIIKLEYEPAAFNNKFYYEDVLDDEIEELFDLLPHNDELQNKRHLLKVQLIQQTTHVNDLMKQASVSYRQQLTKTIYTHLPRRQNEMEMNKENTLKSHQEIVAMYLADAFLLYIRYKDEDNVKSNIYRQKLMREINKYFEELYVKYGILINDMDQQIYISEFLIVLQKVPLPSDDTIKSEADEVLLGLEVEQWFTDLPLIENDDEYENLQRKRLQHNLAKKLYGLKKDNTVPKADVEKNIKLEISNFLQKMSLEPDESLNINFMVDELVNRIKNRQRQSHENTRKISFMDDYDDFGRNVKFSSSFKETRSSLNEEMGFNKNNSNFNTSDFVKFADQKPLSSTVYDENNNLSEHFTIPYSSQQSRYSSQGQLNFDDQNWQSIGENNNTANTQYLKHGNEENERQRWNNTNNKPHDYLKTNKSVGNYSNPCCQEDMGKSQDTYNSSGVLTVGQKEESKISSHISEDINQTKQQYSKNNQPKMEQSLSNEASYYDRGPQIDQAARKFSHLPLNNTFPSNIPSLNSQRPNFKTSPKLNSQTYDNFPLTSKRKKSEMPDLENNSPSQVLRQQFRDPFGCSSPSRGFSEPNDLSSNGARSIEEQQKRRNEYDTITETSRCRCIQRVCRCRKRPMRVTCEDVRDCHPWFQFPCQYFY